MAKKIHYIIISGILVIFFLFTYSRVNSERVSENEVYRGRYQIVFSPHERTDTFLVDTEYGRVWQLKISDEYGTAFEEIYVENNLNSVPYREEYDKAHKIKHRLR